LTERDDRENPHDWGVPVDLLELVQVGRVIEQRIDGNGEIHYNDLEGGFYSITLDGGMRYLPVNLDDTFKTDGLWVNFSAYPANDPGISMWGTPVRLVSIGAIDSPDPTHIVMKGYIRWIRLSQDSGMFGIFGDNGVLYIPNNLDGAFKQDGLYVQFTAEQVRTDAVISRTHGIPVHLTRIGVYNG
jgi:hypothetical protein